MLGDELVEETEEVEEKPFLVEDKDIIKNCFSCGIYRVNGKICGTFKYTNDYYMSQGSENIENEFYCQKFQEK